MAPRRTVLQGRDRPMHDIPGKARWGAAGAMTMAMAAWAAGVGGQGPADGAKPRPSPSPGGHNAKKDDPMKLLPVTQVRRDAIYRGLLQKTEYLRVTWAQREHDHEALAATNFD